MRQLVNEKIFREDLYYRISVIPLRVPPLRERSDDIPVLTLHFLQRYSEQMSKPIRGIAEDALRALQEYSWPGNVRELENAMERAVALEMGEEISLRNLPEHVSRVAAPVPGDSLLPDEGIDLE
ncbi:sigma-54-dependent Fis family transcriptional regulator, partial [Acidobacteriia bacterium AH_259_A11_L15]|nr:sigma-54-dependent Fis family transcriptional regulator [Acidobacteriia bacterium AH_259_A11_L15]